MKTDRSTQFLILCIKQPPQSTSSVTALPNCKLVIENITKVAIKTNRKLAEKKWKLIDQHNP